VIYFGIDVLVTICKALAGTKILEDSQKGIEKKEKLVSIYLTIVAIIAALNGIRDQDTYSGLAYGIFLVTIIVYFMSLGSNVKSAIKNGYWSGLAAAITFSYILVSFIIPISPILRFTAGCSLAIVIFFSLIWSFNVKHIDVEDE
jgi:hypothetical protein